MGVVDTDDVFIEEVFLVCERLGVRQVHCGKSVFQAEGMIFWDRYDILFLEINPRYEPIWEDFAASARLTPLVVACTNEVCGRPWLSALRHGAHRVIDKRRAPIIIEAMLMHLVEAESFAAAP